MKDGEVNCSGDSSLWKCVKCANRATLRAANALNAVYCKQCFIEMVKHKFSSAIGKRRLYKDGQACETAIVYDGTNSGAFLLSVVSQGLSGDARKRLKLVPISCFYSLLYVYILEANRGCKQNSRERELLEAVLTRSDDSFLKTNEALIDAMKMEIETFKGCICAPWIYVHLAALFNSYIPDLRTSDICGIENLAKWTKLLASCSSPSIRDEFKYLCANMICIRIAQKLKIHKIMLPSSSDELAISMLSSLVFARGAAVLHSSNVVDKRHDDITVIRPLRDISEKEIAVVNRFEGSDRYILNVQNCRVNDSNEESSVRSITREFVDDLITNGFTGTVSTILGTANKLHSRIKESSCCALCFSAYTTDGNERYCYSCSSILDEIDNKALLEELLASCTVPTASCCGDL